METIKIESVVEYISKVDELLRLSNFSPKVDTAFFRGHADEQWKLKPSLLRNDGLIKNEDLMYRAIIAKHTSEFTMCSSALDYLVKMQHYGLPTRLLDLTTNPLVALYFACEEHQAYGNTKGKSGEVIVLKVPTVSIKHYDSDTISILSNIAKCKEEKMKICLYPDKWSDGNFYDTLQLDDDSRIFFLHHIGKYYCEVVRQLLEKDDDIERLNVLLNSLLEFAKSNKLEAPSFYDNKDIKKGEEIKSEIKKIKLQLNEKDEIEDKFTKLRSSLIKEPINYSKNYIEWFNKLGEMQLLLHQISLEKSHFHPIINPHDLARVYIVNVKQDNQRIINQMGSFVLFGLGISNEKDNLMLSKSGEVQIPDEWNLSCSTKFIIQPENKRKIIEELGRLGISKSFIYPELEVFAKELGKQYKK